MKRNINVGIQIKNQLQVIYMWASDECLHLNLNDQAWYTSLKQLWDHFSFKWSQDHNTNLPVIKIPRHVQVLYVR